MPSLFTSQTPASGNEDNGAALCTSTTIQFSAPKVVTHLRFFAPTNVSGTFLGRLFQVSTDDDPAGSGTGVALGVEVTFTDVQAGAWNTVELPSPIEVDAAHVYRPAVHASNGRFVATPAFWGTQLVNGPVRGIQSGEVVGGVGELRNGTFRVGATMGYPATFFSTTNYFVDVVFEDPEEVPEEGEGTASFGGGLGRPASRDAVPAGLKVSEGSLIAPTLPRTGMTGSGTVRNIVASGTYEGFAFPGAVNVLADDVIIRNCLWRNSADFWGVASEGRSNVVIEDCLFDNSPQGIQGWNFTARRCAFVHMPKDPFDVGSASGTGDPTIIEDCAAWDFRPGPHAHCDGVQQWVSGIDNLIIRRNWFELRTAPGYTLPDEESGYTSPVFCQAYPEAGSQGVTLVADNVLDSDDYYAIRFEAGITCRPAALRNRLRSNATLPLIEGGVEFEGEGNVTWDLNPYNHPEQIPVQPGLPLDDGGQVTAAFTAAGVPARSGTAGFAAVVAAFTADRVGAVTFAASVSFAATQGGVPVPALSGTARVI